MRLDRLHLTGFRSYTELDAAFCPGVNLILGDNAQGKTNLLESVVYLSQGRSFRTRREQELIHFGAPFCELSADIFSGGREQNLRVLLFPDRRRRQLFIGGVKQKTAAALPGLLTTVLFCPEDLLVLKAGAAPRRRLIDAALCQLRPGYARALSEYTRILEHKQRILKDRFDFPGLLDALPEFNEQLCAMGAVLIAARAKYLRALGEAAARFHADFSGGRETLHLRYETVSTIDNPFADETALRAQLREHQASHYRAELESCQCLSGPHRDDFTATINGAPVKSYGSQGQTRTAAISIKLAERELSRRDTGEEPVLLLDDVLSELDPGRQDFVLNQIRSGQVFITCCERGRFTDIGKRFLIEGGTIQER